MNAALRPELSRLAPCQWLARQRHWFPEVTVLQWLAHIPVGEVMREYMQDRDISLAEVMRQSIQDRCILKSA